MEQKKPRLFVGSSTGSLAVAHALQENLEYDVEVTVWNQGIFDLSASTLSSLLEAISDTDFGAFVLAADDIAEIRKEVRRVPRDNVVFELGLSIGGLGRDRTFIIAPRGVDDLQLPTNLLGITPATYEPNRQDGNLAAALGPAATKIKKAISRLGSVKPDTTEQVADPAVPFDDNDCLSILESWLGHRPAGDNTQAMVFTDVDRQLGLPPGSAARHLEQAAKKWNYGVRRRGANTIMFADRGRW
jgi:hypothetical protein